MGPYRVWIDEDGPGIAITRSLGDLLAKKIGITSTPEIQHFECLRTDQFIILVIFIKLGVGWCVDCDEFGRSLWVRQTVEFIILDSSRRTRWLRHSSRRPDLGGMKSIRAKKLII